MDLALLAFVVCLCDHVLLCRNRTVRNKARKTAQASLSLHMRHQTATQQTTGNYYVTTGESLVENYLQRRNADNCYLQRPIDKCYGP